MTATFRLRRREQAMRRPHETVLRRQGLATSHQERVLLRRERVSLAAGRRLVTNSCLKESVSCDSTASASGSLLPSFYYRRPPLCFIPSNCRSTFYLDSLFPVMLIIFCLILGSYLVLFQASHRLRRAWLRREQATRRLSRGRAFFSHRHHPHRCLLSGRCGTRTTRQRHRRSGEFCLETTRAFGMFTLSATSLLILSSLHGRVAVAP